MKSCSTPSARPLAEPRRRRPGPSALALVAAAGLLAGCVGGPSGNPSVPEPAKPVEVSRYMGLWYEQGRYDASFQEGCEGVTAQYALKDDGEVSVLNTCHQGAPDGPVDTAEGRAVPAGDPLGAKFKVTFFGPALFANYWVLDRGEAYDWAIVGEGSGKFLWILTREAEIPAAEYERLKARAAELGYDVSMLRRTQQPPVPDPGRP